MIKICLRISRIDPNNPEKRKHYEISIDSPLHVLNNLCSHGNTLLPAYDDLIPQSGSSRSLLANHSHEAAPLSPGVIQLNILPVLVVGVVLQMVSLEDSTIILMVEVMVSTQVSATAVVEDQEEEVLHLVTMELIDL